MPKRPGDFPTPSPKTPRIPSNSTGYFGTRTADTPIASPRPTAIARTGRWVSFGRLYRSHPPTRATSPMSMPMEFERGDSAGAFSSPESSMAPTESQGSYGRMQAFEIETPLAVPESAGWAFSTAFLEFAASALLFHLYSKVVPRGRDPADWNRRIMDWIDKYILHKPQAAPPRTVISGTPQPKAHCLPGFPNTFTTVGPSPIAAS